MEQVYQLTIQTPTKIITMQTTDPEDVVKLMQLSGQSVVSHEIVAIDSPEEMDSEYDEDEGEEHEVEEEYQNTPANTKERQPRVHGDITDFGAPGTGRGQKGSAANKPYGSGDNPLTFEGLKESYGKFKSK